MFLTLPGICPYRSYCKWWNWIIQLWFKWKNKVFSSLKMRWMHYCAQLQCWLHVDAVGEDVFYQIYEYVTQNNWQTKYRKLIEVYVIPLSRYFFFIVLKLEAILHYIPLTIQANNQFQQYCQLTYYLCCFCWCRT